MVANVSFTLGELAARLAVQLRGEAGRTIRRVATLEEGGPDALTFFANPKYRSQLANTQAGAVVLSPESVPDCPSGVAALVCREPYLVFAKAARLFHPDPQVRGGIHASAVVAPDARIDPSAWIGPGAVVESGVSIEARVFVGPACVIGADCQIGEDSRLLARVTLCHGTQVGKRVLLHPGAVVGSDGFGFARDGDRWLRIPQIGRVRIGDDAEVGANTTIDRGALGDTVIEAGVIIDNQVQIGHNVRIGAGTAVVACTGISGSTRVGRHCTIGGDVGIAGHLEIGDQVHLAAGAKVTRSLPGPGNYGGVLPVDLDPLWRRNVARLRHLDELAKRLVRLERRLAVQEPDSKDPRPTD